MTGYDLYVFFVCLVMFVSVLLLFSTMLFIIVNQELRAIRHGLQDKKITTEYMKNVNKKSFFKSVSGIVTMVVSAVLIVVFVWTFDVRYSNKPVEGGIAVPRVVLSDSMSYQRKTNTYLTENNLNDQFDTFDLIFTREMPGEYELELYDIVVYELEGELIIHRIIGIEEPNESHPDQRLFQMRGDAVRYSDEFMVEYSQMKAIYRGEKIPFVGSFVFFMQSPPGYLCIILLLVGFIITPIIEKFIWNKKLKRLSKIGFIS